MLCKGPQLLKAVSPDREQVFKMQAYRGNIRFTSQRGGENPRTQGQLVSGTCSAPAGPLPPVLFLIG